MNWASFLMGFLTAGGLTTLWWYARLTRLQRAFLASQKRLDKLRLGLSSPAEVSGDRSWETLPADPLLGVPVASAETACQGPITFRAIGFTSNTFERVELLVPLMATGSFDDDFRGPLLKVRQILPLGQKGVPKMGTIAWQQVHPDERPWLKEVILKHPGSCEVEFDPES